jgi:hypothetical protein
VKQNQSPDVTFYWDNLNWMSKVEVEQMALMAIISNDLRRNDILRFSIMSELPKKILENKSLTLTYRLLLCRLLDERVRRKLPLYNNRWQKLLDFISLRRLNDLLSTCGNLIKRLLPHKAVVRKTQCLKHGTPVPAPGRIRGHRDHGSCSPPGTWLPKDLGYFGTIYQNFIDDYNELVTNLLKKHLENSFNSLFQGLTKDSFAFYENIIKGRMRQKGISPKLLF